MGRMAIFVILYVHIAPNRSYISLYDLLFLQMALTVLAAGLPGPSGQLAHKLAAVDASSVGGVSKRMPKLAELAVRAFSTIMPIVASVNAMPLPVVSKTYTHTDVYIHIYIYTYIYINICISLYVSFVYIYIYIYI